MFSKWTARWGAAQKTGQATPAEAPASAVPEHLRTGSAAEDLALAHLQQQGLKLVERNYRLARGRSRRAGEIDLILRDRDGTLVFVEVRARRGTGHGGAAASVTWAKQQKLRLAAHHYLLQWPELPPCRFDVVAVDDGRIEWLKAAFDAA